MNLKTRFGLFSDPPPVPPKPATPASPAKPALPPATQRLMQRIKLAETAPALFTAVSRQEQEWKDRIFDKLMNILDLTLLASLDEQQGRQRISEVAAHLLREEAAPLNEVAQRRVVKMIEDEILGLGPLEPLIAEPSVSDILVNGYHTVYVERFGKLELTPIRFHDDDHLLRIIDRIVSSVGRRIDESSPMVDARLKDGSRVNAIIPPLALDGPVLSIRRFALDLLKVEDLIRLQALTPAIAEVLQGIVKARLNILISGGTGAGKTTLLNVMSSFIPAHERILTIEDSAELQLQQPHVVRLETRPPNIEGKGQITQRDLVRNSLRMRPDRIILGEVRQEEAFDMLQAMNTGHDGSLTTVHANSARDALTRIENMVAMGGLDLAPRTVRAQIASAINVVLQLERMEGGRRKLVSVQEISGMEGEIITMTEVFKFHRQGLDEHGNVVGVFKATGMVPRFHERLQQRGINLDREVFDPNRSEEWGEYVDADP
ncbi:MAG: pilus assembly protein CpaF [Pseudomonadota bacterium]|nr:pilus assembly protein CpaF [Pseudomonadota bacterium]